MNFRRLCIIIQQVSMLILVNGIEVIGNSDAVYSSVLHSQTSVQEKIDAGNKLVTAGDFIAGGVSGGMRMYR